MKLIDNWRESWRMFSVQCFGLAIAIEGTWALLPDDMKESIPDSWVTAITIVVLVLGLIGRTVKQPKVSGE